MIKQFFIDIMSWLGARASDVVGFFYDNRRYILGTLAVCAFIYVLIQILDDDIYTGF